MSKSKIKNDKTKANSSLLFKIVFAIVIIIVYGQTLRFGFVLDDDLYIVKNPSVQNGISYIPQTFLHGISEHFKGSNFMGYRPATMCLFIIEYSVFGANPAGFHLVNLLLYFLIAVQLFYFLQKLLSNYNSYYPFIIVLLFLLHPIHTEVVANIKSQDELLSGLFILLALNYFIRWNNGNDKKHLIGSCLLFLAALFSKESSIAYILIFPALLWLLFNTSILNSFKKASPLFLMGGLFLALRFIALQDVFQGYETSARENILYAATSLNEIWATKFEILFHYFTKAIFPNNLSWDYSFNQIPVVTFSSYRPIVSILLCVLCVFVFIKNLKNNQEIAFGVFWFLVLLAPTCNLFIMNGTTFGERFLFMPILGAVIIAVVLGKIFLRLDSSPSPFKASRNFTMGFVIVASLFLFQSISRASDWKDNFTLFQSGVVSSPNSARTNVALATEYMNKAEKEMIPQSRNSLVDSALVYFYKTVQIDTTFSDAWYKLGLIHAIKADNTMALAYYRTAIRYNPKNVFALNNLGALYVNLQQPDSAYSCFVQSYKAEPMNGMTLTNLTIVCTLLNKSNEAIFYGKEAINNQLGNQKIYLNMATAYRKLNNLQEANKYQSLANTSN
jgi:tetratricopeptide (TPR) repeat protein